MGTSVKDLLERPFDSRPLEEQLEIVKAGKPKPNNINENYFEKEQWLTACGENKAFFCWTCLLFVSDDRRSVWNTIGYVDKKTLLQSLELHKSTEGHINGLFEYQTFVNKNLVSHASKDTKLNSNGVKSRRILKRIIDVVCHMTNVDSPFRLGIDNFGDEMLLKNFFEYLDILKYYDLNNISEEVIRIVKDSPTVLMHTVSALSEMISQGIKREVQSSSHVSLVFSEHLDADLMSKLSCVLRFVKDGKVHERFTGFINFIGDKSDNALLSHCISEILSTFDVESKFIALSFDGAVIMSSSQLSSFISELSSKYPHYRFVPCYYHDFESVLEQTLSAVFHACHTFFQQIKSMNSFYKSCSKLTLELNEIMKDEILNFIDLKFSDSHFLRIVKMHRQKFILYFNVIVSKYAEYSADDVASASGFIAVLKDLNTVFFLEMFCVVYTLTSVFSEPMSGSHPEYVFVKGEYENLVSTLRVQADTGFEPLWNLVMQEVEKTVIPIPEQSKGKFSQIYRRVMVYMIGIVETRYQSLDKLNFFQILSPDNSGKFVLIDEQVQNLHAACKDTFDITLLKFELSVINSNKEMLAANSLHELLENMEQKPQLQKTFKNVHALANYILSMPCKPPSLSGEASKFDAVTAWSSTAKKEIFTDDWSLLAVEKEILNRLKSEENFMDDFIWEFRKLNVSFQVS